MVFYEKIASMTADRTCVLRFFIPINIGIRNDSFTSSPYYGGERQEQMVAMNKGGREAAPLVCLIYLSNKTLRVSL